MFIILFTLFRITAGCEENTEMDPEEKALIKLLDSEIHSR
jgi:hypothetical protein